MRTRNLKTDSDVISGSPASRDHVSKLEIERDVYGLAVLYHSNLSRCSRFAVDDFSLQPELNCWSRQSNQKEFTDSQGFKNNYADEEMPENWGHLYTTGLLSKNEKMLEYSSGRKCEFYTN